VSVSTRWAGVTAWRARWQGPRGGHCSHVQLAGPAAFRRRLLGNVRVDVSPHARKVAHSANDKTRTAGNRKASVPIAGMV